MEYEAMVERMKDEERIKEEARQDKLRDEWLCSRGPGRRLETASLKTYRETEANREALQIAQYWLKEDSRPNLIIVGPVGSGKSYLMACVFQELLAAPSPWPEWLSVPEHLTMIKNGFTDELARKEAASQISRAKLAPILLLDDLGKTHPGKGSSWVEDQLYDIVDERYRQMIPTVITTELGHGSLIPRCGESVVTRLMEGAMVARLGKPPHPYRVPRRVETSSTG